jgi:ATP-binding cassette subfamily B protein
MIRERSLWNYYYRFFRGKKRQLLLSVVVAIAQSLLILPLTLLVRRAFDHSIPSGDFRGLALIGASLLLLNLGNSTVTLWTRRLILTTVKAAIADLRRDMLDRCYSFSRAYYSQADLSGLQSTLVQDSERLDVMSNALVALLLPATFVAVAISIVLLFLNPLLFLAIVAVLPPLIIANRFLGRRLQQRVRDFNRSFAAFNKGMLFVLLMMDLTRTQTAEAWEKLRQQENVANLQVRSGRMAWLQAAYTAVQNSIAAVASIIILVLGGQSVARGTMTLGALISFYVGVALLNSQLQIMTSALAQIVTGKESLLSLKALACLDAPLPYRGRRQVEFSGAVELTDVDFGYQAGPVLRAVNLIIPAGRTIAIVGANGSGKTTIANLIMGWYRPENGRLSSDGVPYDELDMMHLRQRMGVVHQDPLLFPGTILENITYGSPAATAVEVSLAVELATAHEFIRELPDREATFIGQDGIRLSGGQRQRIVLARALLRHPRLLILDEPTTHLDAAAVRTVLANLKSQKNPPAILLISHDAAIARQAHRLYLLTKGRIGRSDPAGNEFDKRPGKSGIVS